MREDKEIKIFLRTLEKDNSMPSKDFKAKLLNKLLDKNDTEYKGFWNKLFFGIGSSNNIFHLSNVLGITVIFSLLIGIFLYSINDKYTIHEQIRTIKGQEEYGLLNQIFINNPQILVNNNNPLLTESISDSIENNTIQDLIATPLANNTTKNFNFFQLTTSIQYQEFSSNCVNLNTDNITIELFTYEGKNDNSNLNYLKSIQYSTDNSIIEYQLIKDNKYYNYKGNEVTYITDINTDNIELSVTTFNNDIELQEITINNNVIYKLISTKPNDICIFSDEIENETLIRPIGNIITIYLIDPSQNYSIIETQYYFDYQILRNQIMIVRNNLKKSNISIDEAMNYFEYDLPYPTEMILNDDNIIKDIKGVNSSFSFSKKNEVLNEIE